MLFLHGQSSAPLVDYLPLLTGLARLPAAAGVRMVMPLAPFHPFIRVTAANGSESGAYAWYNLYVPPPAGVAATAAAANDSERVAVARAYPWAVDSLGLALSTTRLIRTVLAAEAAAGRRVVVVGHSLGAGMSLHLAAVIGGDGAPAQLGTFLAVSGLLPLADLHAVGVIKTAGARPVVVLHGEADVTIPAASSRLSAAVWTARRRAGDARHGRGGHGGFGGGVYERVIPPSAFRFSLERCRPCERPVGPCLGAGEGLCESITLFKEIECGQFVRCDLLSVQVCRGEISCASKGAHRLSPCDTLTAAHLCPRLSSRFLHGQPLRVGLFVCTPSPWQSSRSSFPGIRSCQRRPFRLPPRPPPCVPSLPPACHLARPPQRRGWLPPAGGTRRPPRRVAVPGGLLAPPLPRRS